MAIEEIVIQCASNAYKVPAEQITLETDIRRDLSNKSMNMLAFVAGIENECGVVIPLAKTGSLKTIQDFVDEANKQG